MCHEKNCNWLRHLLGQCDHYKKINHLQKKIITTRAMTNKELKRFNKELNVLIKDENIHLTLTNIKKVSEHDN